MKNYIINLCNIALDILNTFHDSNYFYQNDYCIIEKDISEILTIIFKNNNQYILSFYNISNILYFKIKNIKDNRDIIILDYNSTKYNEYFVLNIDTYIKLEFILKESFKNYKNNLKLNKDIYLEYIKYVESIIHNSVDDIPLGHNSPRKNIIREFIKNINIIFENKNNIKTDTIEYIYENEFLNRLIILNKVIIYKRSNVYTLKMDLNDIDNWKNRINSFDLKANYRYIMEFAYNRITYEKIRLKNNVYLEMNKILESFIDIYYNNRSNFIIRKEI